MSENSPTRVPTFRQQRPVFHFAPKRGWMNDPNGLIRSGKTFHIFFQHNPHDARFGAMHWGHATTADFCAYEEAPIALFPDATGFCYSGSAVACSAGRVAAGVCEPGDLLLFFTAHRERGDSLAVEEQHLAIANPRHGTVRRFTHNPILSNPELPDFRDPKVIWHEESSRWIMVLTHGREIGIYASSDVVNWTFESTFEPQLPHPSAGPWECPDLFPMTAAESGRRFWVLLASLQTGHAAGGSGTQVFIGDFDGQCFTPAPGGEAGAPLDLGRDFYAAQSFSGLDGEAPLVVSWMSNWNYARALPESPFRGTLSLPRRLALVEAGGDPYVVQTVEQTVVERFPVHEISGPARLEPAGPAYRLRLSWLGAPGQAAALCLFGADRPILHARRHDDASGYSMRMRRSAPDGSGLPKDYETDEVVEIAAYGPLDLDIFVDAGHVEIGCAECRVWISNLHFPPDPAGTVTFTVNVRRDDAVEGQSVI